MEPNTTNQSVPSFDLPQPGPAEAGGGVNPNMPVPETNQQTEANNMEMPAAAPPVAPPMAAPTAAVPVDPQAVPTPVITATVADEELDAEDNDLIEKAWVEKAKAIVEQTKDDPHKQNDEINRVKASYIKKRYNKDIKLNEDQAK